LKEEIMDCKAVKEKLADYLLGELEPREEISISEHLVDCASCKREVQVLEQLFESLRDDHSFKPHSSVYERIKTNTGMAKTVPLLAFLGKPIRCYHAVAALLLGIIITLLSSTLIEQRTRLTGEVKTEHETIHELSASQDSITFYSAPSRRLVSR
jgi:anti-sigma factor RsiW